MDEHRKLRIALGVVADIGSLRRIVGALERLASARFSSADAVLLCSRLALDGWLGEILEGGPEAGENRLPQLVVESPKGDELIVCAANRTHDSLAMQRIGRIVQFHDWMAPVLAEDLSRRLREGACLLFIPVESEELEREVCRALLKFAADRVQAHDLSPV